MDQEQIKQTYSLNDKIFERIKGEAKLIYDANNERLIPQFIENYTAQCQNTI